MNIKLLQKYINYNEVNLLPKRNILLKILRKDENT